jgi:cell wall assembly regulator SMI1
MPVDDKVIGRVLSLLHHPRVARPDEPKPLPGASAEDLAGFEERTGLTLPPQLRRWLSICDGSLAGAGGTFGVAPPRDWMEIETVLTYYTNWLALGWIPVAKDETGNPYMAGTSTSREPQDVVFFVDAHEDFETPTYVVGSDIWHFLVGYFSDELWEGWWPFDRGRMLAFDPEIERYASVGSLPWEA